MTGILRLLYHTARSGLSDRRWKTRLSWARGLGMTAMIFATDTNWEVRAKALEGSGRLGFLWHALTYDAGMRRAWHVLSGHRAPAQTEDVYTSQYSPYGDGTCTLETVCVGDDRLALFRLYVTTEWANNKLDWANTEHTWDQARVEPALVRFWQQCGGRAEQYLPPPRN